MTGLVAGIRSCGRPTICWFELTTSWRGLACRGPTCSTQHETRQKALDFTDSCEIERLDFTDSCETEGAGLHGLM